MSYAPSSGVAASQPDALNTSNVSHGSGGLQPSHLSTTGGHLMANTQGALVGPFPSMAASQSMTRESSYRVQSPTSAAAAAQMQQSQNGLDAAASSLTNAHLQQMSQPALSVQPPSQQYSASGASQLQASQLQASQLQASQLSASSGSQLQQQLSQAVSQAQASVSQQPSQMQNSHAATSQHPSQLQSQQPSQFVSQPQPSQFLSQSQQPSQQASQQPSQFLSQQQQQPSQSQLLSQQMSQQPSQQLSQQPSQQQQLSQASQLSQQISQQPSQQISQQVSQQPSQQQQLSQQQQSQMPQNPASSMQKFLSVSFAPAQSHQSAAAAAQQGSERAASPSPSSGTGQGLQALLQVIEGTGAHGLVGVQVNTQCDALFAAVTSLLRVAGEQDASITALRSELQTSRGEEQALRERMSGLESRLQTMAADAAGHAEAQAQLQTRVQMAEGKCEEATTAAGRVPALQGAQQQLLARVEELAAQLGAVETRFAEREQQLALLPSSPRPDAEQLTQPLREAIQEMVVTCQNLAAKQTDTVHVVQQLFQRVESLEEAMSSVQDVVSKLCATTNQQGLKDLLKLFELPEHLQPYLGNTESRLHILHTRPVFQTLFDQLRLLNEKCDAALAAGSPRTLSTAAPLAVAATDSQFAHLAPNNLASFEGRSLQFDDAAAVAEAARAAEEAAAAAALAAEEAAAANATLFGAGHQGLMDRSALEAADKLVAQLTQTMGEQRETGRGGSGGVAAAAAAGIGGRQSPRAREFHAVSPRNNTSPLKIKPPSAAAAAAASFSNSMGSPVSGSPGSTDGPEAALLGIEVADGDSCVTVAKIYPNSPSSVGGIRKGDRIISFNGTNVASRADFLRALARTRPAQLVPIIFVPQAATTPVATHLVIGGLSSSA